MSRQLTLLEMDMFKPSLPAQCKPTTTTTRELCCGYPCVPDYMDPFAGRLLLTFGPNEIDRAWQRCMEKVRFGGGVKCMTCLTAADGHKDVYTIIVRITTSSVAVVQRLRETLNKTLGPLSIVWWSSNRNWPFKATH